MSIKNTYNKIIRNRWSSINQRCVNGVYSKSTSVQHSPQFRSYHKHNITVNMTKEEFTAWMLSVEHIHNQIVSKGEVSNIDRIDESKGYEIGNMQMISQKDNIEKRFGKTITTKSPEARKKACERKKLEYQKSKEGIV